MTAARAPGKVVLSGAYVVLEGAPAIVAAVGRDAIAFGDRPAELVTDEVRAAIDAGFLTRACAFDAAALRAEGGARKLGLGSSAAILVATMAAVEGVPEGDPARRALLDRARSAHRRAQGGGSGIDVAASALGGVLACRLADDALDARPHPLADGAEVTILASSVAASTPGMLARVRELASRDPAAHRRLLDRAAEGARAAVAARTIDALVAALRAQRDALGELGRLAGAPILTDEVAAVARAADEVGVYAGPAGAGGGDVAIVVAPRGPLPAPVVAAAMARGLVPIEAAIGAPGVSRAESS
jgi:phosphomevalonate kinase